MANLIVKSEIRRQITELNVSGDIYEKLETIVQEVLSKGVTRAKANGRKTVYARDL